VLLSRSDGNHAVSVDGASGQITLAFGQLTFPATQNPSSDVNTLDDYEEGTWTPAWAGSGGQSGQVYSAQTGTYIKTGRTVVAAGRLTLSTLGTITTNLKISGLPFTSANVNCPGTVHIGFWSALTATLVVMTGIVDQAALTATMYGATAAATGLSNLAQTTLSATSDVFFTITYQAAN
jgi:hypothetical protein